MSGFIRERLIDNNAALVQMLGLCPLLAVSNTAINALGLGIATIMVIVVTNVVVSLIRPFTYQEIRIPLFVILIASVVTTLEMLMNAYFHELYVVLGIFIPLIVTNCMIMARAESFASRNPLWPAIKDGFFVGLGFALVLLLLGMIRELVGRGTLFSQAELLFGSFGEIIELELFDSYDGFLIAILPPGAFFVLALLVAIKNKYDARIAQTELVRKQQLATETLDTNES